MLTKKVLMQLHYRLQDIYGNDKPFGGISLLFVGDFHQLPPVGGSFVFTPFGTHRLEKLMGPALWKKVKIWELTEIMRQKDDKVCPHSSLL